MVTPGVDPAQVDMIVTLNDGRTIHRHIDHAIGSVEKPMTDAQLDAKFKDLADGILPARRRTACWPVPLPARPEGRGRGRAGGGAGV